MMFSNQNQVQYKQDTGLRSRPYRDDNKPFPKLDKPFPLGYFSVTTERDYEPTAANLRYFKPPKKFPLDLNDGLRLAIKKPESAYDERLDHLLKFIFDNRHKLVRSPEQMQFNRRPLEAEFVCWRGLLRLLMCTPYEFRQDWCIHVTKYMGTFYMCKKDSEYDQFKRSSETEHQKTMCAWGFKYEQYCLSESPFMEPETQSPVDECAEFSCVFKTKINGIELLYGAEMDGVVSDQPVQLDEKGSLQQLRFVELKVRERYFNSQQQQSYKRFKTRNWWCQSFLVGISDIYVGMRSDKGMLQCIEHVDVRSLPKLGVNYWTPSACANFLIQFLTTVRNVMAEENCPYTTYEFYYNSSTSRITYECLRGKTPHSFLPDWYLAMLQRPKSNDNI